MALFTHAIRQLYAYHFAANRALWDDHIPHLTESQYTAAVAYSHGSVRDQLVHLASVEDTWFCGLRGVAIPEPLRAAEFSDRASLRARWDAIEASMRTYLDTLSDATLAQTPFSEGEDEALTVWQVLLHVVNHGTDHRAQILRALHDLGRPTSAQDYIFYVYDHP